MMDSHRLTAVQQGMLYHHLAAQEYSGEQVPGRGIDIEQISLQIRHPLQVQQFNEAWNLLLSRHQVLRARFRYDAGGGCAQTSGNVPAGSPVQEFVEQATVTVQQYDWRTFDSDTFDEKFVDFKATDRLHSFDVGSAPLIRVALFQRASDDYTCLWTFHHLLLDGRSFPPVLEDLFDCYEALCQQQQPRAPDRPEFSTYLDWYQNRDRSGEREFWQQQLSGFHGSLQLNFDSVAGSEGRFLAERRELPAQQSAELQSFARRCGVTLHTLLQTMWALMMHHYTREDDIVFGSTRACRHGSVEHAERIVGMLINTVPLRVQLDEKSSLLDLLRSVRQRHLAIREYEFTALADIRRYADAATDRIFDSLVVYDNNTLHDAMQRRGGRWRQRSLDYQGQTVFPLALVAYGGDKLTLRLEYDQGKFSTERINSLLEHCICLLGNFPAQADAVALSIAYLTAQQQAALLGSGVSAARVSRTGCLQHLFEQRAAASPERIALSFEQVELSYRELNHRATQTAALLQQNGVRAGDLVGLCLERSTELIIGMLGILKAGAAYVPLDPDYPGERLAWIVQDAGIRQILAQAAVLQRLPLVDDSVAVIDIADSQRRAGTLAQPTPVHNVDAGATAYVIYTSGSTGKPKGVKVSHANVLRLFESTEHWFGFDQSDVWSLFHSTAFDFSVWEIWGALLYGGRLLVVPYWVSRSVDKFHQLVVQESVTVLNQTPSAFRQFMQCALDAGQRDAGALRYLIFGGEALELQSLRPWMDTFGDDQPRLINMYGITETTVHVTYRRILHSDLEHGRGSLIGVPIPDLRIYLLNNWMQPVPPGIVGEMYVAGAGVAAGYLNRDALTAERFVPDPWCGSDCNGDDSAAPRIYKTGDLARQLPDGEFEYLGRSDFQVKVRGFRIETGEIESTLNRHPRVMQSVVDAFAGAGQEKRLVAWLLFAPGQSLSNSELRAHLLQSLPDYMVPSLFVPVDTIPLTHNGKIDRRALPDPEQQQTVVSTTGAPETAAEHLLVGVWKDVLGLPAVGTLDNYFDLGGDSILTIKMVSSLRELGYALSPRQIFEHKTIAALAPYLQALDKAVPVREALVGEVALLAAQQWFFDHDFADLNHWNQAFVFNVERTVDANCLDRAFARLSVHHDSLRARFACVDRWRQYFPRNARFHRFASIDLSAAGQQQAEAALSARCFELQQDLDIASGPLAVLALFTLPQGSRLFICMHHLIMDGVSWRILLEDLQALYHAEVAGSEVELPAGSESVAAWHRALSSRLDSAQSADNLRYWRELDLSGLFSLAAAGSGDAGSADYERSTRTVKGVLPAEQTSDLLGRANTAYGTRINDLLLCALGLALNQCLGAERVLIDMEGHGREDCVGGLDVSRTIGWFTCIYPVLLSVGALPSLADAILTAKENLRAVPDNGIDYFARQHLRRQVQGSAAPPLPEREILFNYLGQFDQLVSDLDLFSFSDLDTGNWHGPDNRRSHLLEIIAVVRQGCLELDFQFSETRFSPALIERLKEACMAALSSIVAHCRSSGRVRYSPSDFPLVNLNQAEIDSLQSRSDLLDLYPLSPMQSLFYTADALDPASGFEQWVFSLHGALQVRRYQSAWQSVIERHDILRSAVVESAAGQSCQLVCRTASLLWQEHDLCALDEQQQQRELDRLSDEDRQSHFSLSAAPLMRITLIRLAERRYQMIWSTHHLCVDGWSWPVIFRDVAASYASAENGGRATAQYGQYIRWLAGRDGTAQQQYWREQLRGYDAPLLFQRLPQQGTEVSLLRRHQLSAPVVSRITEFCAAQGLTLNTLLQALLALVLSRGFRTRDIVFGISSAGRPVQLAGVESIAGPFVNNIPKRIRIPQSATADQHSVSSWLQDIQSASLDAVPFEHTTPMEIQQSCGLGVSQRLFETLLVFQNYSTAGIDELVLAGDPQQKVSVTPLSVPQASSFPITLVARPVLDSASELAGAERYNSVELTAYLQGGYFEPQDMTDFFAEIDYVCGQFADDAESLFALADKAGSWRPRAAGAVRPAAAAALADQTASPDDGQNASLVTIVSKVWAATFGLEQVDCEQSFFDLGGQSVQLVSMHAQLQQQLGRTFPVTALFKYPTIRTLGDYLEHGESTSSVPQKRETLQARRQAARRNRKARPGRRTPLNDN